MKICAISDTHCRHPQLIIPECDLLIHAGDESIFGREDEIRHFARWFDSQPAKYLVWVPGNHSVQFEQNLPRSLTWITEESPRTNILINQEVTINGIKIWGSPVTPRFYDWAWNVNRGRDIKKYWDAIPNDTDIVITHGPPWGILDIADPGSVREEHAGCQDLANRILKVAPKLHIFGHIHDSGGVVTMGPTTFINAAMVNNSNRIARDPVIVDL